MTTGLAHPEIPPAYRMPRPPIARRKVVAIAALALSFAGATGSIANYQPLTRGHYWRTSPCLEDVGSFTSARGDTLDAWEFVCSKADEPVEWAISVINDGWFPITITDVAHAGDSIGVIGAIKVSFGEIDDHIPHGDELEALQPFTIRPGEEYVISFQGVTSWACGSRDTATNARAGVGITYKVGPFTRYDHVDSGPAMNVACSEQPEP